MSRPENHFPIGLGDQKAGKDLAVIGLDKVGDIFGVNEFRGFEDALQDLGARVFFADLAEIWSQRAAGALSAMAGCTLKTGGFKEQLPAPCNVPLQGKDLPRVNDAAQAL